MPGDIWYSVLKGEVIVFALKTISQPLTPGWLPQGHASQPLPNVLEGLHDLREGGPFSCVSGPAAVHHVGILLRAVVGNGRPLVFNYCFVEYLTNGHPRKRLLHGTMDHSSGV
jgi:hypothetical protein